ncbi:class I SAM-dependent methyltransferase [Williamsia sterculiae]|uniref:Methyltransferase domain-containing protein n=1 Tax=Williamsia sterculiae TaxID=1344003 RepID=A0A1N7H1F7_9NOCA|nr:class I SAM-dependent methyltransferase [Williamsia sterculiae]SIS18687.1 Methyltransferase domain-containing protein [Williamsia sterculiae]
MGVERLLTVVEDARSQGQFVEGSVSAEEIDFLQARSRGAEIRSIAEIGFNAGLSAHAFLSANPGAHVTSFDLLAHEYSTPAKRHIDDEFPGRHTLIVGDSTRTVPEFADTAENATFDLIFIDGGHTYEVAIADLRNMKRLSRADTVIVLDDMLPHKPWGEGPIRAWQSAVADGTVVQKGLFQDGVEVDEVGPDARRGWVVGHYV